MLILNLKEVRKGFLINVENALHCKKFEVLDVILQTPGGDIDAAFFISKLIRNCCKELNIIVPLFAKSAGTLICLTGDKILMTDVSELGPLDTQIRESTDGDEPEYNSALNGFKALEQIQQHNITTLDLVTKLICERSSMKVSEAFHLAGEFSGHTSGTLYKHLNPYKIGEYARALEIGEYYGNMILTRYKGWNLPDASSVIKKLVYEYPSHGFAIDCEELLKLGMPAEKIDISIEKELFLIRELLLNSKKTIVELFEYKPSLVVEESMTNTSENKADTVSKNGKSPKGNSQHIQ